VDPRKAELVAKLHARRAKLDRTLESLDEHVTELRELPARVEAQARQIGRWTAIVVGVTAVALVSILMIRTFVRPRARARRRRS
jgi:hypothetical protein